MGSSSHIAGNLLKSDNKTDLTESKNSISQKLLLAKSADIIFAVSSSGLKPPFVVLSVGFLSNSII